MNRRNSVVKRRSVTILWLFALACVDVKPTWRDYTDDLTHVLRDSLGGASLPNVGIIRDSTHLWITFAGIDYRRMSDSAFADRSLAVARLAMRRYEQKAVIESVTVSTIAAVQKGVTRNLHFVTYPASILRKAP